MFALASMDGSVHNTAEPSSCAIVAAAVLHAFDDMPASQVVLEQPKHILAAASDYTVPNDVA